MLKDTRNLSMIKHWEKMDLPSNFISFVLEVLGNDLIGCFNKELEKGELYISQ